MKKIISLILISLMMLSTFTVTAQAQENTLSLFVQNGATDGNGTINAPFGSIEEARDYIRSLKENGNYPENGVTVYIRGGYYNLKKGIKFEEQDSGTKEGPITYRAYKDEKVTFSAGATFNLSEFKKVTDKVVLSRIPAISRAEVLELNLFEKGYTKDDLDRIYHQGASAKTIRMLEVYGPSHPNSELFFEGQGMTLARWPNDDYTRVGEVVYGGNHQEWEKLPEASRDPLPQGPIIKGGAGRLASWKTAPDAWAHGYWAYDWLDYSTRITAVDPVEGTISMYASVLPPVTGKRFYVFNLLEELDIKGEWYLERETGILYFYPPKKNGTVSLSLMLDDLFTLNDVENVSFKALNITSARGRFFVIRNCKNVNIENCELSFTAAAAIDISGACYDCSVKTCHIYGIGQTGINLDGGDSETLTPGNNVVENCWIHNFSRLQKNSAPAVSIKGVGNKIIHNRINDAPQWAIKLNGNDHLIEYNEIYDVLQESADAGVIYAWKSLVNYGTVIRNNYIHDCSTDSEQTHGIMCFYFDYCYSGTTVENNIIVNFPGSVLALNGGRDTIFRNNIMINCDSLGMPGTTGDYAPGWTEDDLEQFGIGGENPRNKLPAYAKYPGVSTVLEDAQNYTTADGTKGAVHPVRNVYKNNVGINLKTVGQFGYHTGHTEEYLHSLNEFEIPIQLSNDPGFVDYAGGNYTVKADSAIYKTYPGFVAPDFENIGIYTPELYEKLGDAVSMRINSPVAHKGLTFSMVDAENDSVTPIIHNDKTMVPIRFMAETLGGTADYDESTKTATITVGKNVLTISKNGELSLNGTILEGEKALIINGRNLVPLRVISEAMNKKVEWYNQGMIIVSDKENILDREKDAYMIDELFRRLSFR